ncbi:uncharacterized protein [Rutidosis leptorrhynchoides]|uniref:uncharacterized protein n=1 Tax=Rutidosis leptorrhynchoides TaxID=125765 RepID=UPI003A997E90
MSFITSGMLGIPMLAIIFRSFEDDLIPIKLRRFDVVIGLDWLSKNRAEIVYFGKLIRIPQVYGEPLMIFGDKKYKQMNLIWCLKVQKYLRKGCHAILAPVSKPELEERRLDDVVVVRDFPELFPKYLPSLPPHRAVEFQINLTPGAAPVAMRSTNLLHLNSKNLQVKSKSYYRKVLFIPSLPREALVHYFEGRELDFLVHQRQ